MSDARGFGPEPLRALLGVAGVGLAALTLAVASWRGGATTYAGASPLAAAACAAMIVALAVAAATSRRPWPAAAAALAVTLPVWAGTANSAAVRSLAEALAPIAFPLVLAVARVPRPLIAAATAVTALVVAIRLMLRDPLFDVHCFATCLPSPFVAVHATGLARAVEAAAAPVFALLSLVAAVWRRARWRDAAGPALLAAGIALRAVALAVDPAELATRSELQMAYVLAASGAAMIGAVATADAIGAYVARRAVLRLARDLRADATRADLEIALRRITRDPSLVLLAADEPAPPGDVLTVRVGGHEVGRIAHRSGAALERALGPAVRLALANATLRERLEQRVARLRATRERVVALGDAARRGFERDLHDGAQQGVLAVLYELRLQAGRAAGTPLAAVLDHAADDAAAVLEELRALAHGIHPAILVEAGLRPALRSLATSTPATVKLAATPPGRYPAVTEATVYRVVDEAVHNAATHADPGRIVIAVVERSGSLVATVEDDGVGGARAGSRGGLAELNDRVGMCGGSFTVRSDAGHGTAVEAIIPCA